jgi:hypothetical protein
LIINNIYAFQTLKKSKLPTPMQVLKHKEQYSELAVHILWTSNPLGVL